VVITANQTVQLTDALDRDLGTLVIEEVRDELLLGEFTPGADYPAVREIFEGFSEAVEACSLSVVDQFDTQIAALGIRVTWCNATRPVHDVQIYTDGAASCRLPFASKA